MHMMYMMRGTRDLSFVRVTTCDRMTLEDTVVYKYIQMGSIYE